MHLRKAIREHIMKTRHLLMISLLGLAQRGVRSWLTVLGIVIGIAAITSLLAIGEGAKVAVNAQLGSLGADIVTISPGFMRAAQFGGPGDFREMSSSTSSRRTSSSASSANLTDKDVMALKNVQGISVVSPSISDSVEIKYLSETTETATIQGVDPLAWSKTTSATLSQGRLLGVSDSSGVLISKSFASSTFSKTIGLNYELEIEGRRFRVVGILADSGIGGGGGSVITTLDGVKSVSDKDYYSKIEVKVSEGESVEDVAANIESRLMLSRSVTNKTKDFTVSSQTSFRERISEMTGTINLLLTAIAGISLLVGALGTVNTMYTSVIERTKQIGVMKALGSTNFEIMKMFVIESAVIGFVGGLIGVLLGLVISGVITGTGARILGTPGTNSMTPIVSPQLFFGCIIFSTIIGAISGVLPARAASKLEPVEALRYE